LVRNPQFKKLDGLRTYAALVACFFGSSCSDGDAPLGAGSQGAKLVGGQPDTGARGVVAVIGARESCSGSLIAPNLVVTARHCVAALAGGGTTVQCGTTNFAAPEAAAGVTVVWADDFRTSVPAGTRGTVREIRTPTAAGFCGNDPDGSLTVTIDAPSVSGMSETGAPVDRAAHDSGGCAFQPLRSAKLFPSWFLVAIALLRWSRRRRDAQGSHP
jgi:hypothetical protein